MQKKVNSHVRRTVLGLTLAGIMLLAFCGLSLASDVRAQAEANPVVNSSPAQDGSGATDLIIDSPPYPPPGYQAENLASMLAMKSMSSGIKNLDVPAYKWDYGCSATSAAMIAAYYDINGYPNMYTGPTNGGVMPMNNVWGQYHDTGDFYTDKNPLAASQNGLDGRIIKGSIDDYWVTYGNTVDPFSGNWSEHSYGTAIGDYMRTSQWAFGNSDGMTHFMEGYSPYQCGSMTDGDGTLGRKLFYQARGYTVTDCYSQVTSNVYSNGFTFAQYMAEIDAGRPVLVNLTGHSVVGTGYDSSTQTIYFHNTWDFSTASMTWTGRYLPNSYNMKIEAVSIVNLASVSPPGAFNKLTPAKAATGQSLSPTLTWAASSGATKYYYCYNTSATCSAWVSNGTATSKALSGLSPNTPYYWHVKASNAGGTTYSNGGWWSFTTAAVPGHFNKTAPANAAPGQSLSPTLSWAASSDATNYLVCYNTSATCVSWISTGSATSKALSGLNPNTTYYWHVRASNAAGTTYSYGGWWSFTTTP